MGGVDLTIVIPSVLLAQTLGAAIKGRLAAETLNVNIGVDLTQRAGADPGGFAQVFAIIPQPGSSISHYDTIAFKNQLMGRPSTWISPRGDSSERLDAALDAGHRMVRGWEPGRRRGHDLHVRSMHDQPA
jgi:hypothetical protein